MFLHPKGLARQTKFAPIGHPAIRTSQGIPLFVLRRGRLEPTTLPRKQQWVASCRPPSAAKLRCRNLPQSEFRCKWRYSLHLPQLRIGDEHPPVLESLQSKKIGRSLQPHPMEPITSKLLRGSRISIYRTYKNWFKNKKG